MAHQFPQTHLLPMDPARQIELLNEVAEAVGGELYPDYSGRGMYGAKCVGIVCADPTEVIELAAARGLRGSCRDSMGKDFIVYWPDIQSPLPGQEP